MYVEMCINQRTVEIFHPFVFVTARDNREMRQSIIACTVRVLRLAGCSVICDLTSWYLPLAEVLTEKKLCANEE